MQTRPTPRNNPDRRPWVVVKVPEIESPPEGFHVEHHFKVPSMMKVAKLIKNLDRLHVAAMVAMGGDGLNMQGMLSIMKDSGPEVAKVFGALIGLSWAHETLDLSTPDPKSSKGWLNFGEAVFEELHDAGYPLEHLVMMGYTIVQAIYDQSKISDEVAQKAAFFFPRLATKTSNDLTSELPT